MADTWLGRNAPYHLRGRSRKAQVPFPPARISEEPSWRNEELGLHTEKGLLECMN